MPHLRLDSFTLPTLPQTKDEITFVTAYKNSFDKPDWLIQAQYEDKHFFIWAKPTEDGYLLKAEKATRPAPNFYIQQALKTFSSLLDSNILSSNIPPKLKRMHLESNQSVLKPIDYFAHEFKTDMKLSIEIGFGSGRHLLYQAKENPDTLYVGIEIHKPSIEQVIKQVAIQELDNVLLLDYDARIFMEFLASNSVNQIFVHFPVPWDKKPGRRVISHAFIEEAVRVLDPKGTLELRTDSENYFAYSLQTFLDAAKLDIHIKKNQDAPITSKYEDRWRKMEKNIYDIHMLGNETSPELPKLQSFAFEPINVKLETLEKLMGSTVKTDIGFIHFERFYQNSDGDNLLRISMGSFERPEHLYLKFDKNSISYFPHAPLGSSSNVSMHQKLQEVLNG